MLIEVTKEQIDCFTKFVFNNPTYPGKHLEIRRTAQDVKTEVVQELVNFLYKRSSVYATDTLVRRIEDVLELLYGPWYNEKTDYPEGDGILKTVKISYNKNKLTIPEMVWEQMGYSEDDTSINYEAFKAIPTWFWAWFHLELQTYIQESALDYTDNELYKEETLVIRMDRIWECLHGEVLKMPGVLR